jgi:hypothetical protein
MADKPTPKPKPMTPAEEAAESGNRMAEEEAKAEQAYKKAKKMQEGGMVGGRSYRGYGAARCN